MNEKQKQFVKEYTVDFNATQAAIRAGYSPKTARAIASKLLTKIDIKDAVKQRILDLAVSQDEVLVRLGAMVRGEVATKTLVTGKESVAGVMISETIKTFDTLAATRDMGKVHAMFIDKQITTVEGMEFVEDDKDE